jgi:exoribonuclease II
MTPMPFQPVREDGRPYWQVIYDEILARMDRGDLELGDVITHVEFMAMLDGKPHHQPVIKAAEHLREHRSRSLMVVRGVGYKLVAGMEQAGQATTQQHRSQRSLVRASRFAKTVDHTLLSPLESQHVTQLAKGLAVLAGFAKMTADKVAEHEQEIEMLKSAKMESNARQQTTESEVADLRRRLDEIEAQRV